MAASDIQQTMSTKIKVDQQEAANQVENLTNKFKDLTAQWKAEQAAHAKLRRLSKKGGK